MDALPSGEVATAFGSAVGQAAIIILGSLAVVSTIMTAIFAKAWSVAKKNGNSKPSSPPLRSQDWTEAERLLFGGTLERLGKIESGQESLRLSLTQALNEIKDLRLEIKELRRDSSNASKSRRPQS